MLSLNAVFCFPIGHCISRSVLALFFCLVFVGKRWSLLWFFGFCISGFDGFWILGMDFFVCNYIWVQIKWFPFWVGEGLDINDPRVELALRKWVIIYLSIFGFEVVIVDSKLELLIRSKKKCKICLVKIIPWFNPISHFPSKSTNLNNWFGFDPSLLYLIQLWVQNSLQVNLVTAYKLWAIGLEKAAYVIVAR